MEAVSELAEQLEALAPLSKETGATSPQDLTDLSDVRPPASQRGRAMRYDPSFHEGLPQSLWFTRGGSPRTKLPSPKHLDESDLDMVRAVRDRILSIWFPPEARLPLAQVRYAVWHFGKDNPYWRKAGKRRRSDRPADPFLLVPDEMRATPEWNESMLLWMSHLTGGPAIFSIWADDSPRDRLLMDLDIENHGSLDIHERMPEVTAPWLSACGSLGLPEPLTLVSGSKGFWMAWNLPHPESRSDLANLTIEIARSVSLSGHSVEVKPGLWTTSGRQDDGSLAKIEGAELHHEVDCGNLINRLCRLPLARHQRSGRIAHLLLPDDGDSLQVLLAPREMDDSQWLRLGFVPQVWTDTCKDTNVVFNPDGSGLQVEEVAPSSSCGALVPPGDEEGPCSLQVEAEGSQVAVSSQPPPPPPIIRIEGAKQQPIGLEEIVIEENEEPLPSGEHWIRSYEHIIERGGKNRSSEAMLRDLVLMDTKTNGWIMTNSYSFIRAIRGENPGMPQREIIQLATGMLYSHYGGKEGLAKRKQIEDSLSFNYDKVKEDGSYACVPQIIAVAKENRIRKGSHEFKTLTYLTWRWWMRRARPQVGTKGAADATNYQIAASMGLVDASSTPKELDDARKTVKRATKSLRKRGLISRPAESVGWRGGCSDYDICPELRGPHEAPDFVREDPDEIDADGWARQRRWDEDEGDGARLDDDVPWVERASQVVSLASPA